MDTTELLDIACKISEIRKKSIIFRNFWSCITGCVDWASDFRMKDTYTDRVFRSASNARGRFSYIFEKWGSSSQRCTRFCLFSKPINSLTTTSAESTQSSMTLSCNRTLDVKYHHHLTWFSTVAFMERIRYEMQSSQNRRTYLIKFLYY